MTIAVSAFPQALINLLRQPVALSVTASLGLHGVLWAASPFIPFDDSKTEAGPLTVDVVQLSNAELSRLPQDSTAMFDPSLLTTSPLTPDAAGTTTGLLPPIPALPPPPNDIFGTLPSLESLSALPSIPQVTDLPPIPLGELPPAPTSNPFVTVDPGELPEITPVPLAPDQIALSGNPITLPSLTPATIPQLPPINPAELEPNLTNPSRLPSTLPPLSVPQPEVQRPIPQAAIDRLRELQEIARLRAENQGTTNDPTLPKQAQEWLARAGNIPPKRINVEYRYPQSACPAKGYATVTVLIDGQGVITRSEITQSSGVPILDDAALKFAKAHNYESNANGATQALWSRFDFDPAGVCVGQSSPGSSPQAPQTTPIPRSTSTPSTPASEGSSGSVPQPTSAEPTSTIEPSETPETGASEEPKPETSEEPSTTSEAQPSPTSSDPG